jgi:hypothetical protein
MNPNHFIRDLGYALGIRVRVRDGIKVMVRI